SARSDDLISDIKMRSRRHPARFDQSGAPGEFEHRGPNVIGCVWDASCVRAACVVTDCTVRASYRPIMDDSLQIAENLVYRLANHMKVITETVRADVSDDPGSGPTFFVAPRVGHVWVSHVIGLEVDARMP